MVCRYELVLWLSTFVTDCLNVHMHVVCGLWFAYDCVYELRLFHTACTIFRCLHDDTRLSETCKEQAGTELNLKLTLKPAENFSEMRVYTIWACMVTLGGVI